MDINVKEALEKNNNFKAGDDEYEKMVLISQTASEEITAALVQDIIEVDQETGEKKNEINLTTAILACLRSAVNLASYMYKDEEKYRDDIKKSRECVVEKIIPAILDPKPCGECEACKKGEPCVNPNLDTDMLRSSITPMLSCSLFEYDLWNKVMYIHTPEGQEIVKNMEGDQ